MKNLNIFILILALIGGLTACDDQLDVTNPNEQTTVDFGDSESELQEVVIAAYNRIRLEAHLPVSVTHWMQCVETKFGTPLNNGISTTTG